MQIDNASKCGGKRLITDATQSNLDGPLFSVVTVVFNGAKELESTILSVLSQSYRNVEYIIIDGGSTDGTLDILREYGQSIDYWVSEPDMGVYDGFNKACRLITGEWTIFLGAGDLLYDTGALALISKTISHVAVETELVYAKVCVTNGKNISGEILNWPWTQMRDRWQAGRPMVPHHQGIFHRKQLLSTESPFDISYRIAADSKLFYSSISKVAPVFVDVIVAKSPLGGLSTEPQYYLANLNEIIRINKEFSFTNHGHLLWFYLKSVSKYAIYKTGGEKLAKRCVDTYRQLTGRKPKWLV
jgi:glycosyltransferase involved in cell wall biosynthesis